MTARTHDIVAIATLLTVATINPPNSLNIATAAGALVGSIVGSLIPDMDQATNRLWDLFPVSGFTSQLGRKLFMGHRAITHSAIGTLIIYILLAKFLPLLFNSTYLNAELIVISIMIGYLSHLAADSLTRGGLPLLYPIKFRFGIPPVKKMRLKSGTFTEKFIIFPLVLAYIIWFIGANQDKVTHLLRLIVR